jgi:hypothetical protein
MAFTRKQTGNRAPYGDLQQHRRTPAQVKAATAAKEWQEAHMRVFKRLWEQRMAKGSKEWPVVKDAMVVDELSKKGGRRHRRGSRYTRRR